MVDIVRESFRRLLDKDGIVVFDKPLMGVEDFGYYLSEVSGVFDSWECATRRPASCTRCTTGSSISTRVDGIRGRAAGPQRVDGGGAMLNKIWGAFFWWHFWWRREKSISLQNMGLWAGAWSAPPSTWPKTAFKIALGLTGVMCLWLGIMRIGEKGGAVDLLAAPSARCCGACFPAFPPAIRPSAAS